jgi:hypothetical protein
MSLPEDAPVQDSTAEHSEDGIYVALTHEHLDPLAIMNKVRSPSAGAIVLFAGAAFLHTYSEHAL